MYRLLQGGQEGLVSVSRVGARDLAAAEGLDRWGFVTNSLGLTDGHFTTTWSSSLTLYTATFILPLSWCCPQSCSEQR